MKRLAFLIMLLTGPVWAVQPDEILSDPALEERARDISGGLRCLVCRNESIDESHADLARDLRLLVRERLLEGDSNEEVVDYIVDRYGEYVLLKPQTTGSTIALWLAGPAMLLLALVLAVFYLRGRATAREPDTALSADEQTKLDRILNK